MPKAKRTSTDDCAGRASARCRRFPPQTRCWTVGLAWFFCGSLAHAIDITEGNHEGRPQFVVRTEAATWFYDRGGPRRETPDNRNPLFDRWRWIYFGDVSVPRVLLLAQHEPDDLPDTLWYLGSSDGGAATAPDGMLVFGFGRGPGTRPQLRGAGQRFTVGLLEMSITDAAQHAGLAEKIEEAIESQETSAAPRPYPTSHQLITIE